MVSGNVSHDVWNGSAACAFGCNSDVQSAMMEQLVLPEERLASQMETSPILDKHLTVMSWSEKEVDSARRCRSAAFITNHRAWLAAKRLKAPFTDVVFKSLAAVAGTIDLVCEMLFDPLSHPPIPPVFSCFLPVSLLFSPCFLLAL